MNLMDNAQTYDLAGKVIGCAMRVHQILGHGFCESVYQNALIQELRLSNIPAESEQKIRVLYKNIVVGDFLADLIVDQTLIIELKAVRTLSDAHEVQLVNYLTSTRIKEGVLLNFGASSLQFKKKYRDYQPKSSSTKPPRLHS